MGYTVGAWNDIGKICTSAIPGGSRLCVWFPNNPNGLGLQELINDAPTHGLSPGQEAMKVKIFIVPISWEVARLVWRSMPTELLALALRLTRRPQLRRRERPLLLQPQQRPGHQVHAL